MIIMFINNLISNLEELKIKLESKKMKDWLRKDNCTG